MKWTTWMALWITVIIQLTSCQRTNQLSADEMAQVKKEIIARTEKHASDLNNLDYEAIMTFYADVEDFIIFGDGYYWGDYITVDAIWRGFTHNVTENTWEFNNMKIHVFSENVASCLVEFDHERMEGGEKKGGHGCFSFSLQKIKDDWKVVTLHVTHNYDVFDENGEVRKWWTGLSPENREKDKN